MMFNGFRCLMTALMMLFTVQCGYAQDDFIEGTGDILQIALPAAAFGSTLIWHDDDKPIFQFAASMGISFASTHALKRLVDRTRPDGGRYSFPSGHTSAAFTGAAFIQIRYGWQYGIPAYLLAAYAGWTRVDADKHFYSDILAGAVVGIGSALIFTKQRPVKNLTVYLIPGTDHVRAGLSLNF